MKKLIVMGAIICAAIVSHGAKCSWSVLNVQQPNGGAAPVGYLVEVYASTVEYSYDAAKAGTISSIYSATTEALGTTGTVKAGQTGVGSYSAYDSGSYYAVIYDAGEIGKASHYIVSADADWSVNAQGKDFSVSFGNMVGTTLAGNKFYGAEWQSVPEPTSGLLLLLGVAGLALRRRRA